jgi:hypothetical protein
MRLDPSNEVHSVIGVLDWTDPLQLSSLQRKGQGVYRESEAVEGEGTNMWQGGGESRRVDGEA